MEHLCPFEDVGGRLQPRDTADRIAPNRLVDERVIERPEDASRPVRLRIYRAEYSGGPALSVSGADLVTRAITEVTIEPSLLAAVRARLNALPNDWYEIFPSDHNLDDEFHFPDPWGEPTTLLRQLASALSQVMPPPVNHNKVSSRRVDRYMLDEIHIDSFEGMRLTAERRTLVWRYFVNLGEDVRWIAVVPFNPVVVDSLLAVEYHASYLDPVFSAASWQLPVLLFPTPPRRHKRTHALKLCTTHLLHSEYGGRGDLLAVINSLV